MPLSFKGTNTLRLVGQDDILPAGWLPALGGTNAFACAPDIAFEQ
jgi:hypothetical protein